MEKFSPSIRSSSILCVLLVLASALSYASTYDGSEMLFKQPDGSSVKVKVWGDEYYQRIESIDGYTLIRNQKGWICYAILNVSNTELVSTEFIYKGKSIASLKGFPYLQKGLKLKNEIVATKRKAVKLQLEKGAPPLKPRKKINHTSSSAARGTLLDKVQGLAILIDFSDEPASIDKPALERYFNAVGYNEFYNNGSVRDYFLEVSGGILDYSNTVTGYYRAKYPKTYYDGNTPYGKTNELLQEAYEWLDSQGFDFSTLTTESGEVRAVNFYYAGYPSQGWTYGLWPHMSYQSFYSNDGVHIGRYQITNIGSSLTLATTCHENGHMVMGWPDLYDYGYDGFASAGLGYFCLMAYPGASNNPVPPNPYLRDIAGWENVTPINSFNGNITLTSNTNNSYRYDKPDSPNEYFLIESRTMTRRNISLPDEGLLIWHIDQYGYNEYQAMTSDRHFLVSLEQADGRYELESASSWGDSNDAFKTKSNNTFNDYTSPDALWWNGTRSNLSITNISGVGSTMTATVGQSTNALPAPDNLNISENEYGIKLTWKDNSINETGFKIERRFEQGPYAIVATVASNTISYTDNTSLSSSGTYTYRLYAFTETNGSPYSSEVSVVQNQSPWFGYPESLYSVIEAENFDFGGESIAYHNVDGINTGNQYRAEAVDFIEACSEGGFNIRYIKTGEWMEYTIQVPISDTYEISTRVSSDTSTGKFRLELNGQNITGTLSVPSTNGWQNWTSVKSESYLTEGIHVLRFYAEGPDFNVNSFRFNNKPKVSLLTPANYSSYNALANILISADAFDPNGSILKVEFYQGSVLLGTSTSYPYEFNWTNAPVGSYTITARVYDYEDAWTNAEPFSITVNTVLNNLALNKPVTVSSSESASYAGSFAVDGNGATRWASLFTDPQYIIVDLGQNYEINRVKINWEAAYAKSFKVQFSSNNVSWTTIQEISNNTSQTNDLTGLAGTARYVKINGITRATVYGYSIYELEVYGNPLTSTPNIAYNKTVTTTSNENGGLTGTLAVDGDESTRWASRSFNNHSITVDLGNIFNINRVKIVWEAAYGKDYQVQGSTDNITWSNLKDIQGNSALINDLTNLTGAARYIKVNCINRGTIYGFSIYELEVYGTLSAAHPMPSHEQNNMVVYPHPSNETVNVIIPSNKKDVISATMYSQYSQKVGEKTIEASEEITTIALDVQGIAEGIYMLSVKTASGNYTRKIIVKH